MNKKAHEGVRKEKGQAAIGHQQQSTNKSEKYGSWGPVYKNKQNFIDMHICWCPFEENIYTWPY